MPYRPLADARYVKVQNTSRYELPATLHNPKHCPLSTSCRCFLVYTRLWEEQDFSRHAVLKFQISQKKCCLWFCSWLDWRLTRGLDVIRLTRLLLGLRSLTKSFFTLPTISSIPNIIRIQGQQLRCACESGD